LLLLLLLWYCLKLRRIRNKKQQRRRNRKSEENDNEDDGYHYYAPVNSNTNGHYNSPGQDNIQLMRYNQSPPPQYREVVPTSGSDAEPVFNMSTAPGRARATDWTASTNTHYVPPVELPSPA
jgi:hypothetical protein